MVKLKVVELFAGVGGFRIGLEGWQGKSALSGYQRPIQSIFQTVWSNQWEPATKLQHASMIYEQRFGKENHSNIDIEKIKTTDIPDHDLLVGGFPCQDYSVAKQLSRSQGITGKKGVLWWQIHRILEEKGDARPNYILLENVDRLIKSPVNQRGRDFAIILASLCDLGYAVEWRVVNAADYGLPQKRKRVFIFAFQQSSAVFQKLNSHGDWIQSDGLFANAFKIENENNKPVNFEIKGDLVQITKSFNKKNAPIPPFCNTGLMMGRQTWTMETKADYKGKRINLGDILEKPSEVTSTYYINGETEKWIYMKGAKKEPRKKTNGEPFYYTEGAMSFPDDLSKPARTIITSEGGPAPSRFKHVIRQGKQLRRLTPIELERANMFPDNHTLGVKDSKRAFLMGNALVVGLVEKAGKAMEMLLAKK